MNLWYSKELTPLSVLKCLCFCFMFLAKKSDCGFYNGKKDMAIQWKRLYACLYEVCSSSSLVFFLNHAFIPTYYAFITLCTVLCQLSRPILSLAPNESTTSGFIVASLAFLLVFLLISKFFHLASDCFPHLPDWLAPSLRTPSLGTKVGRSIVGGCPQI